MKKKILSLFLALAMCLSLLPTAAFAADGAQDPAEPGEEILAPEHLGDPEKDPDPEQEEQQADPSVKQDEAVAAVQALMDALPGEVTADNADELQAQLMAIDAALEALSDEQLAQFLTRYETLCEALSNLTAVQAGETHEHYLCGGDTCNEEGHEEEKNSVTFTKWPGIGNVIDGGAYYLTGNVYGFTVPKGVNLTLCLNGFSIISGSEGSVITVKPGATFTLCNCKGGDCYIGHSRNVYGAGVFVGEKIGDSYVFEPERMLSRGEFVSMALAAMDVSAEDVQMTGFCDDASIPTWAKGYAVSALNAGVVSGVSTAEGVAFRANDAITLNEAAVVLNRLLRVTDVDLSDYDVQDADNAWCAQALANLQSVSVIESGRFSTDEMRSGVTRAQAAEILSAAMTLKDGRAGKGGLLSGIFG